MSDLVQRVRDNLERQRLVPRNGRLLVAVSGGLDSMALLGVLRALAPPLQLKLSVAHANHQLRGAESEADAAFVAQAAAQADLPICVRSLPVREAWERSAESVEMAARRLRHRFFVDVARELHSATVALAHHADDQAELVLLRLLRGAGGEGLGGMDWASPSPSDSRIRLIRPLLNITRRELAEFAESRKISFREDRSNSDLAILRNRVRHELRPLLERDYNPALGAALVRAAQVVGAEADYVARAAARWLKSERRAPFERLHVAVQRVALRRQLWALGHDLDFDQVERLRLSAAEIAVSGSVRLGRTEQGLVEKVPASAPLVHSGDELRLRLHRANQELCFGGRALRWRFSRPSLSPQRSTMKQEQFDAQAVGSEIILRHWRAGDRFQPLGFARPSKVQNLLVNRRIPAVQRRHLLVAATRDGVIFWIEGLPPGEPFKVAPKTRRALVWTWGPE